MNDFNTDLIQILAQGLDINEFFRQQLEIAINDLLKSELTVFLDYEKWEYKGYGSGNSRNGYYHRNLKTTFGQIELQIPRIKRVSLNKKQSKHMLETQIILRI